LHTARQYLNAIPAKDFRPSNCWTSSLCLCTYTNTGGNKWNNLQISNVSSY